MVQIQSKSNINTERLNNKLKDPSIMEGGGGGEEWAGPVFPHPTK